MNLVVMEKLKTTLIIVFLLIIIGLFAYIVYKDIMPNFGFISENKEPEKTNVYEEKCVEKIVKVNSFVPFDEEKIKYDKQNSSLNNSYKWILEKKDRYFEINIDEEKNITAKYFSEGKELEEFYENGKTYKVDIERISELQIIKLDNVEYPIAIDYKGNLFVLKQAKGKIDVVTLATGVQRIVQTQVKIDSNMYDSLFAVLLDENVVEVTSKI